MRVGYLWLDCNFDALPQKQAKLNFWPYGINALVSAVITANIACVAPNIDAVIYTTPITVKMPVNDVGAMARAYNQLLQQKWLMEREPQPGTHSHASAVHRRACFDWMEQVQLPTPSVALARALVADNKQLGRCNAKETSTEIWAIQA
ncbi:hypothetical protein WI44_35190 [Burkholderia cepacia]|uniref:hypothetical protein n=1 Tax=Burkholderia cepacia TaxID=292 RepID=UPI00075DD74E|nr:hypothetical protein [Burkholderia cepacia]KVA21053.1 hypothetical protein WI44_35190 [Burkholderia cepacia]KVA43965.1 hypothetical protein WI45_01565 [Burkholderia cepacia]